MYRLNRFASLLIVGLCASPLVGGVAVAQTPAPAAQAQKTLYQRLGGYDAIAAVTDDFVGRLVTDQTFARFFVGFANDSKGRIRQNIVDFFCAKTGGPCLYVGRDMKTAHAGLGVTKAEWDRSTQLLTASLKKFNVGDAEQKDFIAIVAAIEKDIVEKP